MSTIKKSTIKLQLSIQTFLSFFETKFRAKSLFDTWESHLLLNIFRRESEDLVLELKNHFLRLWYSSNFNSSFLKLKLGSMQGLLSLIFCKHSSNLILYFCIMYEVRIVDEREIPEKQCIRTLPPWRLFSINSKAGSKTNYIFWSKVSSTWKVMCLKCSGNLKGTSATVQTALILCFSSSLMSLAKWLPLIQTSPRPSSASMTFCPYFL